MSTIVTEQGILHYESVGKGRPIILLHGWINSWDVWRETMLSLANGEEHRVYALDFWGFGHSATRGSGPVGAFDIASYVDMVREFMDSLGIGQAPLAGHSMGGTVALQFALSHPNRTQKVVLVGAPICGETLNPFLKVAGYNWIAKLVWRFPFLQSLYPHVVALLRRSLLAGDSERVQKMILRDSNRTSTEVLFPQYGRPVPDRSTSESRTVCRCPRLAYMVATTISFPRKTRNFYPHMPMEPKSLSWTDRDTFP